MKARGRGHIVTLGSTGGTWVLPGMPVYAMTKAALHHLVHSLRIDLHGSGVRVSEISPGRVETPMMLDSGIADMSAVAAALPARRLGRPEEVAEAVVWLASDAASFVVGHNLCVDGGFLAS